jgi:hypothetical protein
MRQESGTENWLKGVWGSSATDVYAVGENGTILHYGGSEWSKMNSMTIEHLYAVWGTSGANIYAVGAAGTILHFNGVLWSDEIQSGTTNNLRAIWGSGTNDIYVVGDKGTILHYDGSNWSSMDSGTTAWLLGVWGTSDKNLYAVGGYYDGEGIWFDLNSWDGGAILHYDGTNWSEIQGDISYRLTSIWGTSASNIYTVGAQATILHYTDGGGDGTCLIENLYGEYSDKAARVRIFRDKRLAKTLGGRLAINAYYSLSPLMVKIIGYNDGVKRVLKSLIDTILPLCAE